MKNTLKLTRPLVAALLVLIMGHRASALNLSPGEVLVTDAYLRAVFKVNLVTGVGQTLSNGMRLQRPVGIALGTSNQVYVVDEGSGQLGGAVLEIDPTTGEQFVLAEFDTSEMPSAIAVDADNFIYVTVNRVGYGSGIIRVDPYGGPSYALAATSFRNLTGITIDDDGDIYVTDTRKISGGALYWVDSHYGAYVEKAYGGYFHEPLDVFFADGKPVVLDANPGLNNALITVDSDLPPNWNGGSYTNQELTASGRNFKKPARLAREYYGSYLVVDTEMITRVQPATSSGLGDADQYVVCQPNFLIEPTGIAIVPGRPQFTKVAGPLKPIWP